jgi:hypothetical protein
MTRRLTVVVVLFAVAIGVGALGFWQGTRRPAGLNWHTGVGYVGDHQISVRVGDWSYGFVDSVPMWIDAQGSQHHDSWPGCLGPVGAKTTIRFASVTVAGDGIGRPVVAVDCRGSGPSR